MKKLFHSALSMCLIISVISSSVMSTSVMAQGIAIPLGDPPDEIIAAGNDAATGMGEVNAILANKPVDMVALQSALQNVDQSLVNMQSLTAQGLTTEAAASIMAGLQTGLVNAGMVDALQALQDIQNLPADAQAAALKYANQAAADVEEGVMDALEEAGVIDDMGNLQQLYADLVNAQASAKAYIQDQIDALEEEIQDKIQATKNLIESKIKDTVGGIVDIENLIALANMVQFFLQIDLGKLIKDAMSNVVSSMMGQIMKEALKTIMSGLPTNNTIPRMIAATARKMKEIANEVKKVTDLITANMEVIAVDLWGKNINPAMGQINIKIAEGAAQQSQSAASLFDAKHQLETQLVLQKIRARAHKDYHPSTGMCEFGSATKSLAASERKSELAALQLARRSQDRALGKDGSAAAPGNTRDKRSRLRQFREKFCDPRDNNSGLEIMCKHIQNDIDATDDEIGAEEKQRMNKDIDYLRTVDAPWTLEIDFFDGKTTNEEEEVLALAANLYGNMVFYRPNPSALESKEGKENQLRPQQELYLDMRALLAKRSVAENSFNAITSMKAQGSEGSQDGIKGSKEYLTAILEELGISNADDNAAIKEILGDQPSYYAQMEVLTKKIYQSPEFYTNLYDKPANVARKEVALQAIGLMQKFDLFKSYLRQEASMSILLELAVMDLQDESETNINADITKAPNSNQ